MSGGNRLRDSELAFRLAGGFGALTLRALHLGTTLEVEGPDPYGLAGTGGPGMPRARASDPPEREPLCFVFWHEQLLPLAYAHRGRGTAVLASDHRDGEYIARILDRFGYVTVRGSSTRGGRKALRGLVRAAGEGRDLAITPDGPRGPARQFRPEALAAASLTGIPVIPVAAGLHPERRAERSWDRMQIPSPGARIHIAYGEPRPCRRGKGEDLADQARALGAVLDGLSVRASDAAAAAAGSRTGQAAAP